MERILYPPSLTGRATGPTTATPPEGHALPHGRVTAPVGLRPCLRLQSLSMEAAGSYYTEEHILTYPVEYIAGIDLYNAGEFHAAHDAWEERWMGPVAADEKLFLQAMIQSAVAFHHLQIGRPGAARRMYLMAKEKFARLGQTVFMSLDLQDYQEQLDSALAWLLTVPDPRELEQPDIQPPVIRLLESSQVTKP